MAILPGYDPQNLQDVLQQQAQNQSAGIQDQYNQSRRSLVARLAANGQLMGGTADYPLTDLDTSEAGALSGVQSNLSKALAGIPSEDWLNNQNFQRSYNLANYIGSLNQPSTLDQVFQGIGAIGPLAAAGASFF